MSCGLRFPTMSRLYTTTGPDDSNANWRRGLLSTGFRVGMFVFLVGTVLLAQPALAQQEDDGGAANPICQDSSGTLASMIEGFVQITTALGVMGLLVVWQADSLMEMFALSRETRMAIKQHKWTATKSATVVVILGPLFIVAGSAMGLPIAECVNLIPF